MEIVHIKNDHIVKEISARRYGCVCKNCGTSFIFSGMEASISRTPIYTESDCYIKCPNCDTLTTLNKCLELKNEIYEILFKAGDFYKLRMLCRD